MEKRTLLPSLLITALFLTGCATPRAPEVVEAPEPLPRPPVGIVRSTNLAERYLVFEAEFRIPEGMELILIQDGVSSGRVTAGPYRRRKFQVADILEGRPKVGDLLEPVLPMQPKPTQ